MVQTAEGGECCGKWPFWHLGKIAKNQNTWDNPIIFGSSCRAPRGKIFKRCTFFEKIHFAEILGSWVWVGFFGPFPIDFHGTTRRQKTCKDLSESAKSVELGGFWPFHGLRIGQKMVSRWFRNFEKSAQKRGLLRVFLPQPHRKSWAAGSGEFFFSAPRVRGWPRSCFCVHANLSPGS